MDTGIFCGSITKDQLVEQNKQLSQQIKENQHNIQLHERWDAVWPDLGTDALETRLRRCDSLASALAKPKFPEFPDEVRKLNLEGLMYLCLSFSKSNNISCWESFTASKLHSYMRWRKITLGEKDKEKILNRMRTKSIAFEVFKSILDNVQREGTQYLNQMEVAAQPTTTQPTTTQPTTQPTTKTSLGASQAGENKRAWTIAAFEHTDMSKRRRVAEQEDVFEYSHSLADKLKLRGFWAGQLVQILEQHKTWGQIQLTDHVRARCYKTKVLFVIDWPEHLAEPNLDSLKVFANDSWGEVEIKRTCQLVIRAHRSQGQLIASHVFDIVHYM